MHFILLLAAAAAPDPAPQVAPEERKDIVVTAGKPEQALESVAMPWRLPKPEKSREQAIGLPLLDSLRGMPGISVATSGPKGSQTQVRIQGAEANHTLLFVDGIRFNDPAAGNEARFELLNGDGISGWIMRGTLSAFYGSEAIGGVLWLDTGSAPVSGYWVEGLAEVGTQESVRAYAIAKASPAKVNLVARAGWLRSGGVDSFDGSGDRDGYDSRSASFKAVYYPVDDYDFELGAVGHWIEGVSEYDGFDPLTFRRADTLDETRNRLGAVRAWAKGESGPWSLNIEGSFLASANRNLLGNAPLNRTAGRRFTTGAQLERDKGGHKVVLAVEHQGEDFRARDNGFFGASDQDRSRDLDAGGVQWEARWASWLTTDLALRHDRFSAFHDATTFRAAATLKPLYGWELVASYGEGIAQPSFYDLYGFFPGSFIGNPDLRPERSEQWQASISWKRGRNLGFELNAFTARLRDEIVDVFNPATFRSTTANALGVSRRRGVEAVADVRIAKAAKLHFTYSWLDAEERQVAGALPVREVRRPRHSGMLAGHGESGPFAWGASLVYVGKRRDLDFDAFPARAIVLDDYVLASVRLGWQILHGLELYVRAENALDARYQDVIGYRTPGRSVHAGLRFDFDDFHANRPPGRRP